MLIGRLLEAANLLANELGTGVQMYVNTIVVEDEAETRLASVTSWRFVRALSLSARTLSEMTSKTYVEILEEARKKILNGEDHVDVLWYYDMLIYKMEHPEPETRIIKKGEEK